ncbi:MAG: TIGR02647 family protein [Gammaproteobacteria bacterium]|nr:TIGR02647 family protein [Gammaproteobacteria bacterium]
MTLKSELVDELNVLAQYKLSTTMEGIKVHTNAKPEIISATQRLFDKGLITQVDGGYLTEMGHEAAEHLQKVIAFLTPH